MEVSEVNMRLIGTYYQLHYDDILQSVTRAVKNHDEAKDIVQAAFIRLMTSKKLISEITMPAFTYRIIQNLLFDRWRHLQYVNIHQKYVVDIINNMNYETESLYSCSNVEQVLEQGIAILPKRSAAIFRMNVNEDRPVSEISRILNMNYKTVGNLLYQSRKEVREYLIRVGG